MTSADHSDALLTLHALNRTIGSLIARVMRERSESLFCVGRGEPVDYFVQRATAAQVHCHLWRLLLRMCS